MTEVEASTASFVVAHVEVSDGSSLLKTSSQQDIGGAVLSSDFTRTSTESGISSLEPAKSGSLASGDGGTQKAAPTGSRSEPASAARIQSRLNDLRKLFNLPADEMVVDDFHCALQKKLLLQGRMYVFEHHVCFHCNLFGYTKDKVIPLKEVTMVRKRKNYGFPNSIEIVWRGKREFFTSFLSREDAYRLILCAWNQSSEHGRGVDHRQTGPTAGRHRRTASSPVAVTPHLDGSDNAFEAALRELEAPHSDGKKRRCGGLHRFSFKSERGAQSRPAVVTSTDGTGLQDLMRTVSSDDTIGAVGSSGGVMRLGTQSEEGFDLDASDPESEEGPDGHVWVAAAEPAPPVPEACTPLVTGVLDCSVIDFCQRFLADQAQFFIDFHQSRGDKKVQCSDWRQHAPLGRVRDLQFIAPIKAVIGPSQTHCHQTQRYRLYAGEQLVFETSQAMTDIPYGDHFTVEARWDITNVPGTAPDQPQIQLRSYVAIPFTKNTMWKRTIEKGAMEQCREAHNALLSSFRSACKAAAPPPRPRPAPILTNNASPRVKRVSIADRDQVSPVEEEGPDEAAASPRLTSTAGRTPRVPRTRSDIHCEMSAQSRRSSLAGSSAASHSSASRVNWPDLDEGVTSAASGWWQQRWPVGAGVTWPTRSGWLAGAFAVIFLLQLAILYEALVAGRIGSSQGGRSSPYAGWQEHVAQLQQDLGRLQLHLNTLSAKLAHIMEQLGSCQAKQ